MNHLANEIEHVNRRLQYGRQRTEVVKTAAGRWKYALRCVVHDLCKAGKLAAMRLLQWRQRVRKLSAMHRYTKLWKAHRKASRGKGKALVLATSKAKAALDALESERLEHPKGMPFAATGAQLLSWPDIMHARACAEHKERPDFKEWPEIQSPVEGTKIHLSCSRIEFHWANQPAHLKLVLRSLDVKSWTSEDHQSATVTCSIKSINATAGMGKHTAELLQSRVGEQFLHVESKTDRAKSAVRCNVTAVDVLCTPLVLRALAASAPRGDMVSSQPKYGPIEYAVLIKDGPLVTTDNLSWMQPTVENAAKLGARHVTNDIHAVIASPCLTLSNDKEDEGQTCTAPRGCYLRVTPGVLSLQSCESEQYDGLPANLFDSFSVQLAGTAITLHQERDSGTFFEYNFLDVQGNSKGTGQRTVLSLDIHACILPPHFQAEFWQSPQFKNKIVQTAVKCETGAITVTTSVQNVIDTVAICNDLVSEFSVRDPHHMDYDPTRWP